MERAAEARARKTLASADLLEAGLLSKDELTEIGTAVADQLAASIARGGPWNPGASPVAR